MEPIRVYLKPLSGYSALKVRVREEDMRRKWVSAGGKWRLGREREREREIGR